VLEPRKNTKSDIGPFGVVHFPEKRVRIFGQNTRISTSGGGWRAWGPRQRVSRILRGDLGSQTQEKIRNPISGRSGWSIFTKNSKVGFDEKSEHFHIRRWLARMENPITDLLGCT
jgi:hypothetical protein